MGQAGRFAVDERARRRSWSGLRSRRARGSWRAFAAGGLGGETCSSDAVASPGSFLRSFTVDAAAGQAGGAAVAGWRSRR